jgi:hypothetical protein
MSGEFIKHAMKGEKYLVVTEQEEIEPLSPFFQS